MQALPRTRSCFVCGTSNPGGLALEFVTDGTIVTAKFRARPEHVGFKGVLHGGIVATVLDEVMVWVCGVRTGRFAYCAELNVRFALPVRPDEELKLIGEMVINRRDRIFEAQASLIDGKGTLRASATGVYLPIKPAAVEGMLDDFVGDIRAILRPTASPGGGAPV